MTTEFTTAQFRLDFPEFASETQYTNAMIAFWYGMANSMLNVRRWGEQRIYGLSLLVAHNITLAAADVADVAAGADPGRSSALIGSQGAGGVSVSFDNSASLENNAGQFNETRYGRMYIRLARQIGIGAIFVGDGSDDDIYSYQQ